MNLSQVKYIPEQGCVLLGLQLMYTLSHESDDDHYRDFLQTVRFLEGPDGSVEPLEESLREFRSQLPLGRVHTKRSTIEDECK